MTCTNISIDEHVHMHDEKHLLVAVSVVAGNVEGSLLAKLHLHNTLIPALDDATDTDGSLEGTTPSGAVKLLSLTAVGLLEPASVLHGDGVALGGGWAVALLDRGLGNTHCASCGSKSSSGDAVERGWIEEASHVWSERK